MTSTAAPAAAPAADSAKADSAKAAANAKRAAIRPILLDVGLPVGGYYLLTKAFGMGTVDALIVSSLPPLARTVWTAVRQRSVNALAALMVVVNAAGIATAGITGDPRLMLAKDAAVTGLVGLAFLVTAVLGRPVMNAAVKPAVIRGDVARAAAWERLDGRRAAASGAFRRASFAFSGVWAAALLAEAAVRVALAYSVPASTAVGLQTVSMIAAVCLALVASRNFAKTMGILTGQEAQQTQQA